MAENFEIIKINSFNCRGLRNKNKRQNIFNWLKSNYMGITFLQETHSSPLDEKKWEKEWGGIIYYSHGEYNARGVSIMIPTSIAANVKYLTGTKDKEGRFLLLSCEIENMKITLINIYSPTKDNLAQQNSFLSNIKSVIEDYSDSNIILGGDLNTYLNIDLDKKGGKIETQSSYSFNIGNLCEEYSLSDIWRIRNPDKLEFTRRERSRSGIIQSRLDYWLISVGLTYLIQSTTIKPGNSFDHSIISLILKISGTNKRGKGHWKFNNSLLFDKDYVQIIKNTISNITAENTISNKNTLWEYAKCQIRTDTLKFSIDKAKRFKKAEQELCIKLETMEKNLDENDIGYLEYIQCKSEWENLMRVKTKGAILRSKAKWIEEGEQNTKYFLNLEKRNYNSTYIKKLIDKDNKEITY